MEVSEQMFQRHAYLFGMTGANANRQFIHYSATVELDLFSLCL